MQTFHSATSTAATAGALCWAKVGLPPEGPPSLHHSPTWAIFSDHTHQAIAPQRAVVDDFGDHCLTFAGSGVTHCEFKHERFIRKKLD